MNKSIEKALSQKKIMDMMTSMHFKLSENYKLWNIFFDCIEILISVILCGLTFFDFKLFLIEINITMIIGFISIFLFAFTLIKQRLDFKSKAEKHRVAGKLYSAAKNDLAQEIIKWEENGTNTEVILNYLNEAYKNLNNLEQIPEKKFHKLKHFHQKKIEFSIFLDSHKTLPWFLCKLVFNFKKIATINNYGRFLAIPLTQLIHQI